MQKKHKRILSGILAAGLMISSLPIDSAFAATQSDKTIYKKDAFSYTFKDKTGIKKITVNGKIKKIKVGVKSKKITFLKKGKYSICVTNKKGKVKKYTFILDKTKPSIQGALKNVVYDNNITIKISDNYALASITENGQFLKVKNKKVFTKTYSNNGTYRLVVKDKAGNKQTKIFTINKNFSETTAPATSTPSAITPNPTNISDPSKTKGVVSSVSIDNSNETVYTKITTKLEDGSDMTFVTKGWYLIEENDVITYDIKKNILTVSRNGQEIYDISIDKIKEETPVVTGTPTNNTTTKPSNTPDITPYPTKPSTTSNPVITSPNTTSVPIVTCDHKNVTTKIVEPKNDYTNKCFNIGYTIKDCKDCGEQIIDDYTIDDWDAVIDTQNKTVLLGEYTGHNVSDTGGEYLTVYDTAKLTINGKTELYNVEIVDGNTSFADNHSLTEITIEKGVKINSFYKIFNDCSSLREITFRGCNEVDTAQRMFAGCKNLTSINGLNNLDFSKTKNMKEMFIDCSSLKNWVFNNIDVSNVTNMESMFSHCINLSSVNISNWNMKNVTNMSEMFAGCNALKSISLYTKTLSKVEDMSNIFADCENLSVCDLSEIPITSSLKNTYGMFNNCKSLINIDVHTLYTKNVVNMGHMFNKCTSAEKIILCPYDSSSTQFSFASAKNLYGMFWGCENVYAILGISGYAWDMRNVENMQYMFAECKQLDMSIDFKTVKFDTSHEIDMNYMFWDCNAHAYVTIYLNKDIYNNPNVHANSIVLNSKVTLELA